MEKLLAGFEQPYEVEGSRRDKTRSPPLRFHAKDIPFQGRMIRVTELRDITESRQAEQEKAQAQKVAGEQKQLALVGQVAAK